MPHNFFKKSIETSYIEIIDIIPDIMTQTTTTLPPKPHAFLVLDALRGVAAICIVIYHCTAILSGKETGWPTNAPMAVDFFFVLSGFVIAHAYEQRLMSGMTFGQFMRIRLIRLYPLYFLGLTLPLVAMPFTIPAGYWFGLFFIPTPQELLPPSMAAFPLMFPLNAPAWSLSLEILINIVYAKLCRKLDTQNLIALVALASGFLGLVLWSYAQDDAWQSLRPYSSLARVTFSFFAGVLLHRIFILKNRTQFPPWVSIILALGLIADFLNPYASHAYIFLSTAVLFPLIIWVGAGTSIRQQSQELCAWLGRISYALYILHWPLLTLMKPYLGKTSAGSVIAGCGVCLLAASILDKLYDQPIRNWLNRKLIKA